MKRNWISKVVGFGFIFLAYQPSNAGVFSMPHFVEPDQFSLGFEPELTFTDGAGLGANIKYTHGLGDLVNLVGMIGSGTGPKKFRLGAAAVFDFFPDIEGQPGVGLGTQILHVKRRDEGRLEMTLIPYIHKTFASKSGSVEPYVGFPFGMGFREHDYDGLFSLSMGTLVWKTESLKYVMELGINIDRSDTYLAGGFVYYH